MKFSKSILGLTGLVVLAGCASFASGPSSAEIEALLKSSFGERGLAKLDRLDQSALQRACSDYAGKELPKGLREKLEKAAVDAVKTPEGSLLGNWQNGERIAQNGRGLQFTDTPETVAGGNCYACHQIRKDELSYGNIGPSLYNYGKLRGVSDPASPNSDPIIKYTWAKIWNSHAFNACSQMPRYGDAAILNEQGLKDVMALLLDPRSPVNQ
jgi:L-cysteine S-thiosulfotransferase